MGSLPWNAMNLQLRRTEQLQEELDRRDRMEAEMRVAILRLSTEAAQWRTLAEKLQGYVDKLVTYFQVAQGLGVGGFGRPAPPTVPIVPPATATGGPAPAGPIPSAPPIARTPWRRPLHDPPVAPTTPPLGLGALGLGGPISSDWEG